MISRLSVTNFLSIQDEEIFFNNESIDSSYSKALLIIKKLFYTNFNISSLIKVQNMKSSNMEDLITFKFDVILDDLKYYYSISFKFNKTLGIMVIKDEKFSVKNLFDGEIFYMINIDGIVNTPHIKDFVSNVNTSFLSVLQGFKFLDNFKNYISSILIFHKDIDLDKEIDFEEFIHNLISTEYSSYVFIDKFLKSHFTKFPNLINFSSEEIRGKNKIIFKICNNSVILKFEELSRDEKLAFILTIMLAYINQGKCNFLLIENLDFKISNQELIDISKNIFLFNFY